MKSDNLERTNPELDLSDYKSKNAQKRSKILNSKYKHIVNKYKTSYQTYIKRIVESMPKSIVLETLNVQKEMKSKHYISSKLGFTPFYKIQQCFEYNCNKYGVELIYAPKDFPSTQMCSCCGSIKKMSSQKEYICKICGSRFDRDINAAFNLENYAYTL